MSIPYLCIVFLGLLIVGGGFYVSWCRAKLGIVGGCPQDPANKLHKAVRAHANATEYVPIMALVIYMLGLFNPPGWIVGVMIGFTLARYLSFFGLAAGESLAKPNLLRFLGALLTYILGLVLLGYLFCYAII